MRTLRGDRGLSIEEWHKAFDVGSCSQWPGQTGRRRKGRIGVEEEVGGREVGER